MGRFSTKKKDAPSRSGAKRIEENLERNKITFDALFRFFERLGTTFDLKRIVRLFLMTLAGQLGLKRVSLYLLIPGEKRLEAYHSLGVRQKAAFPHIEADSMFLRWLREVTVPVHIDDFFTSRGGAADNEMELMSCIVNEGFAYVFPIDDGEELLGAIFFSGKVTGESFADFDKELLRMLVRVAAIAIKNAWLYQAVVLSKMELEKFSSVKKEFINHTSHELRTPLTVLKSALWSIESDEIGEDILMSMSKDAVLRLESKVEQLLSLNDIELNENIFGLEPEDISSLLEDCLKEVIPEIEEKQISVMVDDRARYREVMVDAPKIKIVLRSIIDNAINSVERGGNITVTISISDCAPDVKQGIEIGDWNIARGEG
ncbi:MAG: hypothetical protein KAX38_09785, partial [Candidatus Krumholzibacteria bacterium]|nr:hypothetical protein [Candidatus Krumholzibacteria bacterium]